MLFSNNQKIPLPLAVWLASDDYDFVGGVNRISATSLLRPIRQIVLAARVPLVERDYDVADFIASRKGHAYHDSIEKAWSNPGPALRKLGYPQKVIDAVRINPTVIEPRTVPVFLERRSERTINGYTISGKFDQSIEGELYDTKSTSVWSWIKGTKDEDYSWQGSIYRWLNPDILTGDNIHIQFIFTDFSKSDSRRMKDYPSSPLMSKTIPLKPLDVTEKFIVEKTNLIRQYWDSPEDTIPHCNDAELWRSADTYKYYSNPDKTDGRATRNFETDFAGANEFLMKQGKGIIKTIKGEVKACGYCPAFKYCRQKDQYFNDQP